MQLVVLLKGVNVGRHRRFLPTALAKERAANGRAAPYKIAYLGIGNENWGCGGNMRAEYYADEFRKYNSFIKNYDRTKPIARIAAGSVRTPSFCTLSTLIAT